MFFMMDQDSATAFDAQNSLSPLSNSSQSSTGGDEEEVLSAALMPGLDEHLGLFVAASQTDISTFQNHSTRTNVQPTFSGSPHKTNQNQSKSEFKYPSFTVKTPFLLSPETQKEINEIVKSAKSFNGGLLKRLREVSKVTCEEVQHRTKIQIKYIHALESESYDALPAPVYFRGFLQSYLKYFGIERPDFIDAYLNDFYLKTNRK